MLFEGDIDIAVLSLGEVLNLVAVISRGGRLVLHKMWCPNIGHTVFVDGPLLPIQHI